MANMAFDAGRHSGPKEPRYIGVLDIVRARALPPHARALFHERCPLSLSQFGFEDMKVNGFEQLFINTTNEQLQRLFNDIIFKQEAAEYERESIEWDRTAFPDNMPCIELLSKKPHGLLRVLDNECLRGMAASDGDKLVSKFNKQHGSHANYDVCGPASVFRRKVRFLEVVGGGEAGPCAKYATKIENRVGCSRLLRANRMGSAPRRTTSSFTTSRARSSTRLRISSIKIAMRFSVISTTRWPRQARQSCSNCTRRAAKSAGSRAP